MTNEAAFWDRIARKYAAQPIKNMAAYNQTLDHVRKHLTDTQTVLELGCGTGSTALLLAPHVRHLTATDISAGMIEVAQEKVAADGPDNVSFRTATPFDVALPPGSFDVILAFNFLHMLPDIPAALDRVAALLKPGGLFISKTPCVRDMGVLLPAVIPVMRLVGKAPYVNAMRARDLDNAFPDAGFTVLETAAYPARSSNRFIVARMAAEPH